MGKSNKNYLALTGGVGGAKLALGLSRILREKQLNIVVNTGDDFQHMDLHISPDIDTLIYTLADVNNKQTGWGRENETWNFMSACKQLGMETWFSLGDMDLATHMFRKHKLKQGLTLSEVTAELCERFGVHAGVIPMSDDPVCTVVDTNIGRLPFQEYFVKHQCLPEVKKIQFDNLENADISREFEKCLDDPDLQAIIICPSNPFLSVQPILSLHNLREKLQISPAPVIIVSPIINGQAVKGPTAKIMKELELNCDAVTIADLYRDIADGIVIDNLDAAEIAAIENMGIAVLTDNIMMSSLQDKCDLAESVIQFADKIRAL